MLAWNDQLMAVEVSFETGAVGADHTHSHTQCSYVLSGHFRYTVEGESTELAPGDSIVVPSGLVHGTVCLEKGFCWISLRPAAGIFFNESRKKWLYNRPET